MISINGKTPGGVKVKVWRALEGFNPLENGEINVKGTIERITMVYGISTDEV